MTVVYEVPLAEFVARQEAMVVAQQKVDGPAMARIIAEVAAVELVIGTRYRIVTFGGKPEARHVHVRDKAGEEYGLDLPHVSDPTYLTIEGVYHGRGKPFPSAGLRGLHMFDIGGQHAAIADMDMQKVEIVPPPPDGVDGSHRARAGDA